MLTQSQKSPADPDELAVTAGLPLGWECTRGTLQTPETPRRPNFTEGNEGNKDGSALRFRCLLFKTSEYNARCTPPNVPAHRPRASDPRNDTETQSRGSMQPAGSAGSFLHDYLYLSAIGHVIHLTSHVATIGQQLQQANLPYVLYRILAAENTRHDQAIHLALCQRAMRCFCTGNQRRHLPIANKV